MDKQKIYWTAPFTLESWLDEQEVLQFFGKIGVVITDSHIVYTSGKHGAEYVNKDAIYPHTGRHLVFAT